MSGAGGAKKPWRVPRFVALRAMRPSSDAAARWEPERVKLKPVAMPGVVPLAFTSPGPNPAEDGRDTSHRGDCQDHRPRAGRQEAGVGLGPNNGTKPLPGVFWPHPALEPQARSPPQGAVAEVVLHLKPTDQRPWKSPGQSGPPWARRLLLPLTPWKSAGVGLCPLCPKEGWGEGP